MRGLTYMAVNSRRRRWSRRACRLHRARSVFACAKRIPKLVTFGDHQTPSSLGPVAFSPSCPPHKRLLGVARHLICGDDCDNESQPGLIVGKKSSLARGSCGVGSPASVVRPRRSAPCGELIDIPTVKRTKARGHTAFLVPNCISYSHSRPRTYCEEATTLRPFRRVMGGVREVPSRKCIE